MSNYKTKKIWKRIGIGVAIVALLAVALALANGMLSGFRDRNSDNLIKLDDNYLKSKKTDYGLEVVVDDDGVIKLKGQTTRNEELIVQTVTLPAGTYTISGIAKPNLSKIVLRATWGEGNVAYAGLDSQTFTLEGETLVTVSIVVEGAEGDDNTIDFVNRTIKPVIIEGKEPGDFYA